MSDTQPLIKSQRPPSIFQTGTLRESMGGGLHPLATLWQKPLFAPILFILIMVLGIVPRVWEFSKVPPGINVDEASIGLEAYDLYHFGVDRNGDSFPVYFVSWGSGMDALEGYILIPFMVFGLTPVTVRLPILLSGILTLPLLFFIAKKIWGINFALVSMFLLAISPWHIILSRWGHDENIVPFVFALGFACVVLSTKANKWFIVSMVFFGLSLYAYAALYVAVPVFLACAIPILLKSKRVNVRDVLIGLVLITLLGFPLVIYVIINKWDLNTVRLGIFTIPRLPLDARFLVMTASSHNNFVLTMIKNAWAMIKLLFITQSDGNIWNVVDSYGYLYVFSFPFTIIGAFLLLLSYRVKQIPEKLLALAWLFAALSIGLFQPVNINRIGLIFIPIILCTAAFLIWLGKQNKVILVILTGIYLLSFTAFNLAYHGADYQKQASEPFAEGLLSALKFADKAGNNPICVTGNNRAPYIYVLFSEQKAPSQYLDTIKYVYPNSISRNVISLGRYTFGLENCSKDPTTVYVLYQEQPPIVRGLSFNAYNYGIYHVYIPKK
ncbi:MAG: glycosyltransferase family 39 protein [Anaerolineales bacterium]